MCLRNIKILRPVFLARRFSSLFIGAFPIFRFVCSWRLVPRLNISDQTLEFPLERRLDEPHPLIIRLRQPPTSEVDL